MRESALSRPAGSLREAIGRVPQQMGRNLADRVSQEFGTLGSATIAAIRTPGARYQAFKKEVAIGIKSSIASALGTGQVGRYLADKIRGGIRYDKDPQKNFERMRGLFQATNSDLQQIKSSFNKTEKNLRDLGLMVKQVAQDVNRIKQEQSVQQRLIDQLSQAKAEDIGRKSALLPRAGNDNVPKSPAGLEQEVTSLLSGAVGGALTRLPFSRFVKFGVGALGVYAAYQALRFIDEKAKNATKETERLAKEAERNLASGDSNLQTKGLGDLTRTQNLPRNSSTDKAIANAIKAGASLAKTPEEATITGLVGDYQQSTTNEEKQVILSQLSAFDYKTVQDVVSRFQVLGLMNDLDRYIGNRKRNLRNQSKSLDQYPDESVRRKSWENRSMDDLEKLIGIKKDSRGTVRIKSESKDTIYLDSSKIVVEGDLIVKGKIKPEGYPDWADRAFNPDDNTPKTPGAIRRRQYPRGRVGAITAPGVFGKSSSVSLSERYARFGTNMEKQQFLAYGQLPRGFENIPGHMGILGSPGAVMARGVMPLGQYGGGGVVGGYGGMPSVSGGGSPDGGSSGGGDSSPSTSSTTTDASNKAVPFSWGEIGKSTVSAASTDYGKMTPNSRGYVDARAYYQSALKSLEGSKLVGFVPKDGARFGIEKGTKEEWARFMTQLTKQESGFNVNTVGDRGNSIGLSQMKAGEYGIRDPRDPLQAQRGMIKQFEKYIVGSEKSPGFGSITGQGRGPGTYAGWGGASAYFGPLRGNARIENEFMKHNKWMQQMRPQFDKAGESLPSLSLPPKEMLNPNSQPPQPQIESMPSGPTSRPTFFENGVPSSRQRSDVFRRGGVVVNLDTNWSPRKNEQTQPMIVIPDNATKQQRDAAQKYVSAMEQAYKQKFGQSLRGKVVTRSQNQRGRANTIHTEPFSVNDKKAVEYFTQTKEGRDALAKATQHLASIPGAVISEPHDRFAKKRDTGAVSRYSIDPETGKPVDETMLARRLIGDLKSMYDQPSQPFNQQATVTAPTSFDTEKARMAFPMPGSQQQTKLEKSGKSADQVIADVAMGKIKPGDSIVEQALTVKGLHEGRDRRELMSFLKSGGKANSLDPYTTPWCAAFVNASLAKAGIKGTGTAWAPDFFKWGQRVSDPSTVKAGDVVVSNGHVSIATGPATKDKSGRWSVPTVGGNESNMVKLGKKLFSNHQVRRATEEQYTPELIEKLKRSENPQAELEKALKMPSIVASEQISSAIKLEPQQPPTIGISGMPIQPTTFNIAGTPIESNTSLTSATQTIKTYQERLAPPSVMKMFEEAPKQAAVSPEGIEPSPPPEPIQPTLPGPIPSVMQPTPEQTQQTEQAATQMLESAPATATVPTSPQAATDASAGSDGATSGGGGGGGGAGPPDFRHGPNQAPSPGSQGIGSFGRCYLIYEWR
jgi:ribosomal protein L35AE/L33A